MAIKVHGDMVDECRRECPDAHRATCPVLGIYSNTCSIRAGHNYNVTRKLTMTTTIHQGYIPGCIGRIAELHALYYHQLTGFGVMFEAKVARELAQFCEGFNPKRDGLWLLLQDGRIEGSIAIDGHGAGSSGAHLRWFITSDKVRGGGNGASLLTQAIEFCDARGYGKIHLATFAGLHAARHLYEKFGFVLAEEQRGKQWGTEVSEQRFVRGA